MTMRPFSALLALILVLTGCVTSGGEDECPGAVAHTLSASCAEPGHRGAGIDVQAEAPVMVTREPLGDVVVGQLSAGDTIRATCIETAAETNAGYRGSAIKVHSGDVLGFAATTTFPTEGGDRQAIFDTSAEQLAAQLDPC